MSWMDKFDKQPVHRDPYKEWEETDTAFYNIQLFMLKRDNKITEEEYYSLVRMNNSPDKENQEVVKVIVSNKDKE
jgi:hypothetical protein